MKAIALTRASLCALILLTACGHAQSGSAEASPGSAAPSDDDDAKIVSNLACAKVFNQGDFAGVLEGTVAISIYPMRDNACHFESSAGPSMNLYSGNGFTDQIEWKEPAANRNGDWKPVPGVGDQAFYRGSELLSKKGDYYCAVTGYSSHPMDDGVARKIGAWCNKVFAAR
jgi:hypothetical protein